MVDYYSYYSYSSLVLSLDEMPKLKDFPTIFAIVCIHFISSKVSSWDYSLQANNPHSYYHGNNKISFPVGLLKHFHSEDLFMSRWKGSYVLYS